jgi:hypothetical protein
VKNLVDVLVCTSRAIALSHRSMPSEHLPRRDHGVDVSAITNWPAARDVQGCRIMLGALLVSWRARLNPADVGLPSCRRLKGLVRKDVAKLAGVSPRWYEMFERGVSKRRFSAAFVTRVADVLRLDVGERAALNRLALPEVAATVEYFERLAKKRVQD